MISVVIPNFNGGEQLAKNLPKLLVLLEKSKLEYEVIVVDDASTDDSKTVIATVIASFIRGDLAKLRVVARGRNEGFASTVDAGIRAAKGEIVFTVKTDAMPENADYFQIMLDHFGLKKNHFFPKNDSSKEVFAVSAALKTVENDKTEIRGQGVLIFFRGFFLHFRTYADYVDWLQTMRTTKGSFPKYKILNTRYSMWADGSAMAVRRDLYLKIGGFDKLYNPFYWEDVDLGYRAWKAGYRVDFEPRAVLLHDYESGAIVRHYTKKQVNLISQRNQFIFVWKNSDWKHQVLYFLWEAYHATVALKNRNWDFFRSYWQAVLRWPEILVARWRQKEISKLSDDEVLQGFVSKKNAWVMAPQA